MSNFLNKAPWASKGQGKADTSTGENAQQSSGLFSKAPRSSKPQDKTNAEHGADAAETGGGGFLSKVPWTSKEKEEQPPSDTKEESLTTILSTREDRTNFLLLVAECTESMRTRLLATFDPNETGEQKTLDGEPESTSRPGTSSGVDKASNAIDKKKSQAEHAMSNITHKDDAAQARISGEEARTDVDEVKSNAKEQDAKIKAAAVEKLRKEHERRVKEVQTPDMKDLQKASLASFDDWSQRVVGRVGEAVNQVDQAEEVKKTSVAPKQASAQQSTSSKQQRDRSASDAAIKHLYPPIETVFVKLDEPRRVLILHSMLLLMISLETYSSYSRVLLTYLASCLDVPIAYLAEDESKVAQGLLEAAKQQMNADEHTKKKAEENAWSRRVKVGLGVVGGAALIGVTGGLAAPLLAAGVGSVMGGLGLGATATATYLGAMAGSAPLVGALFGAYGGRMAGQMVDNYAKEINDFAFIPVHRPSAASVKGSQTQPAPSDRRLRVTIGITGWLNDASDVVKPWQVLAHTGIEAFALRFELEALINLGNALTTYIKSAAWGVGTKAIVSQTVFATLSAGLWPLGIVKAARVVDNPFSVARSRSEKAGRVLADALINKVQGERPVTLVGYSLGARVIYYTLDELSRRKAFGLVESVVLAGAAVPADSAVWRRIRSVVSGRVVNVFSTNDYLLGFLYRTSSLQYGVAGLQAIDGVAGIENIDVSDTVDGHTKYRFLTGRLLSKIGFEDVDETAVARQEKELNQEETKEEAERKKAEAKQEGKETDDTDVDDMEKEVQKKNEKSMIGKVGERMSAMTVGVGDKITGRNRSQTPDHKLSEDEKFRRQQEKELQESVGGPSASAGIAGSTVGSQAASSTPATDPT